MFSEFVDNGQGQSEGELGNYFARTQSDPGLLQPYVDRKGNKCLTVNTGTTKYDKELKKDVPIYKKMTIESAKRAGFPVENHIVANATLLRKDEWLKFDRVIVRAARQRLRAWSDLAAVNSFTFDGMSKLVLEHETMSDPGSAVVDMDGITEGRGDRPTYQLEGLPLPITHVDFNFSQRQIAVSRNTGTPIDTTMAEAAGRRVAETIEETLIGTVTGLTAGEAAAYSNTPQVEGYITHPDRITNTSITVPTTANHATTLQEVLGLIETMANQRFFGPFMLYHSTDWDQFMNDDYVAAAPQNTLRERLKKIDAITDVRRLDFLTNTFTLILVQMTPDVARAVIGLPFTTVQWPSKGGLQQNFKVMTIQVPQIRSDFNGRSGITHATTT